MAALVLAGNNNSMLMFLCCLLIEVYERKINVYIQLTAADDLAFAYCVDILQHNLNDYVIV